MPTRRKKPPTPLDSSVVITYEPRGAPRELFRDRSPEILLAGPAGTGKSLGALHKLHAILSKYPKARGLMSRKTRTSMTNSCIATFDNHVLVPQDEVHFHKQDQQYQYPNGSVCAVSGLDDVERIKSTDYDVAYIQEATECQVNDVEITTTRLRNWKVPYQQLIMDCNPDRPTHWLKVRADKKQTKMLLSFHKDNPILWHEVRDRDKWHSTCERCRKKEPPHWSKEGEAYLAKLDRLTGARRARMYLGQWVTAEGVVYKKWDPQVHIITRKQLPMGWDHWPRYWSIDWGYTHPVVWQEWIENPETSQIYLLRQIFKTEYMVEDLAKRIRSLVDNEGYTPRAIICDHDPGDRATFERHTELLTSPAYKDIAAGIQAVEARLEPDWCPSGPGLFIVRDSLLHEPDVNLEDQGSPVKTEDEFDGYVWPKGKDGDINRRGDEVPVDKDNHGMDGVRYMVAFMDSLAEDPEEFEAVVFNEDEVSISRY